MGIISNSGFCAIFLCSHIATVVSAKDLAFSDVGSSYLLLPTGGFVANEGSCEQTYGSLPCTSTILGNLFLILVYGYLMYMAATFLSNGSELLLEILGPGVVGGLFLPILGALPDAMLILAGFGAVMTTRQQHHANAETPPG